MTEPWPNSFLRSDALDPLSNPLVQLDASRELTATLAEWIDQALALHKANPYDQTFCAECMTSFPCRTRRTLTGADEAGAA